MANGEEVKRALSYYEGVNNSAVADPRAKAIRSFKSMVWIGGEARTYLIDLSLDPPLQPAGKFKKTASKLA